MSKSYGRSKNSNDSLKIYPIYSDDMNPLDRDRQASMADEGGSSAALMEYQPTLVYEPKKRALSASQVKVLSAAVAATVVLGSAAFFYLNRNREKSPL